MKRAIVPTLCLAAWMVFIQSFLPRPYGKYPFCVPTQLKQASWDWSKYHSPVRLAKQVRHALLPITDATPWRRSWQDMKIRRWITEAKERDGCVRYAVILKPNGSEFVPIEDVLKLLPSPR